MQRSGLLPAERPRKRLVRMAAETDPKHGKRPEDRTLPEILAAGVVPLDKPSGPSSHQIAAWLRLALNVEEVGHGGTLDPKVTGVLPVTVNGGTKVVKSLLEAGKEYVAVCRLHEPRDEAQVRAAAATFVGKVEQTPPVRSAVKRRPRLRRIYYLDVLEVASVGRIESATGKGSANPTAAAKAGAAHETGRLPPAATAPRHEPRVDGREGRGAGDGRAGPGQLAARQRQSARSADGGATDVLFRVGCQAGTYIRNLCVDLGKALGTRGHMQELRRTRTGLFTEHDLVTLHDCLDARVLWERTGDGSELAKCVLPVERITAHLNAVVLRDSAIDAICHGAPLAVAGIAQVDAGIEQGELVAYHSLKGELVAIAEAKMTSREMLDSAKGIAAATARVVMAKGTYPRVWKRA